MVTEKNNKGNQISRRSFLTGTATAAAGFMIVPRHVLGGKGYTAPSDKVLVFAVKEKAILLSSQKDRQILPFCVTCTTVVLQIL